MRPSDFPRGPDGVRFRVYRWDSFTSWVKYKHGDLCSCKTPEDATMIASALNQVAEREEKQDNQRKDGDG